MKANESIGMTHVFCVWPVGGGDSFVQHRMPRLRDIVHTAGEQGDSEHAEIGRALHCLGISQSEDCQRVGLQAWIRQGALN